MADDLATMKSRVADELARTDLTSQIANCISDAIKFYQSEQFKFNKSRGITFPTVAAQEFYGTADNAAIPLIFRIDTVILYVGTNPQWLDWRTNDDMESLNFNGQTTGDPFAYAYFNKQIRLGPIPTAVRTVRVTGHISYAAPASDVEASNPWMIEAEKLIRCRAKYELALNYLKDASLAEMMAPQILEAYDNLKGIANRVGGSGFVAPMQF